MFLFFRRIKVSALSSHASIPSALLNTLKPSLSSILAKLTSLSQNKTNSGLSLQFIFSGSAGIIESSWSLGNFFKLMFLSFAASINQLYISSNFSLFKYPFTTNQAVFILPSYICIFPLTAKNG